MWEEHLKPSLMFCENTPKLSNWLMNFYPCNITTHRNIRGECRCNFRVSCDDVSFCLSGNDEKKYTFTEGLLSIGGSQEASDLVDKHLHILHMCTKEMISIYSFNTYTVC